MPSPRSCRSQLSGGHAALRPESGPGRTESRRPPASSASAHEYHAERPLEVCPAAQRCSPSWPRYRRNVGHQTCPRRRGPGTDHAGAHHGRRPTTTSGSSAVSNTAVKGIAPQIQLFVAHETHRRLLRLHGKHGVVERHLHVLTLAGELTCQQGEDDGLGKVHGSGVVGKGCRVDRQRIARVRAAVRSPR